MGWVATLVLLMLGVTLWITTDAQVATAEVIVYPGPGRIPPSDQYAVTVAQNGRVSESFVYISHAQWETNRSKTTSWTTFSFSGEVTVTVTKLQGNFSTCHVLPSRRGVETTISGNTVQFKLSQPGKFSVEFDDDITHPMLVFADPLETDVPALGSPDVVYFGPGVHEVGAGFHIDAGKTVYLAGGAYVRGQFVADDASGVVIRGRGILSGEQFEKQSVHLIDISGWDTRGLLIEGITLINAPHYNITIAGERNTARNVKMIGWYFSTDGISTGRKGVVEDCFFKVNDDAIKLYWSDMVVRNCVIWQLENGAPFQISWNMPSDNHGFHVSNCDVIRAEHRWNNDNLAIFDAVHGGKGHMSGYLFENIHIENADWRLFYITLTSNEFADPDQGFGSISDLVFRNITVTGPMQKPNTLRGQGAEHRVANIRFEDVSVNGRYMTSPEDGNFEIDPESTGDIQFVVSCDTREKPGSSP